MTLANALTALRALLLAPTVFSVLGERWAIALVVFAVALVTDILDGWVARRRHQVTLAGQLLDPAVDKAFYVGLFSALAAVGRIPILALVMFLIPQLGLAVGTLVLWRRRGEFAAEWPGKAAAALTGLSAGLLLLTPHGIWALWVAVGGQFTAGAYYLARRAWARTRAAEPPRTAPTRR